MSAVIRRTIDELLARYELEPELEDIFVEGSFDKELLDSVMPSDTTKAVYEIDTVDISFELVRKHSLTEGRKQRVIALARELAQLKGERSYVCLVDKDLDHWFGKLEATERLHWTKYCSIELHFFSPKLLEDLLIRTCKARIGDFDLFYRTVTSALSTLYAMRLADKQLGFRLRWLPIEGSLSRDGEGVSFSLETCVDRLLQANGKSQKKCQFNASITHYLKELSGDCRDHIRGHDFVNMLVWAILRYKGMREFASESALQRLFILSARLSTEIASELRSIV
jgi:hypothetical protein